MSATLFLTPEEMVELTGKHRSSTQAAVLKTMGIEHKIRADGKVLVLRQHIEEVFGAEKRKSDYEEIEPNWDAA